MTNETGMISGAGNPLPLTYRQREVQRIMDCISARECCVIVGASSAGKSNLMRFLLRSDVRQHYLGSESDKYRFILLDVNSMRQVEGWQLFELGIYGLIEDAKDISIDEPLLSQFEQAHREVLTSENPLLAQRHFERIVGTLRRQGLHIALLFDEFDQLLDSVDSRIFQNLRALRDQMHQMLIFVAATRCDPVRMRNVEVLYELFASNILGLGPYTPDDALLMLKRLTQRTGLSISEVELNSLIRVTGGHPGLLRAGFWALPRVSEAYRVNLAGALLESSNVWTECEKLWGSLTDDEQWTLVDLVQERPVTNIDDDALRLLHLKGLVTASVEEADVFCELFDGFVRHRQTVPATGIEVDERRGLAWKDGRPVEGLTKTEFALLAHFARRPGEVCSRDDIAAELYPDEVAIQDNRIDTHISRLRGKIEPDSSRPTYIHTVYGRGFRFVPSVEEDNGDSSGHTEGE